MMCKRGVLFIETRQNLQLTVFLAEVLVTESHFIPSQLRGFPAAVPAAL